MPRHPNELPWWLAVPLCFIFGAILVVSIPEVRTYFEQLFQLVLGVIFLAIIVGAVILGIIWFVNKESTPSFSY